MVDERLRDFFTDHQTRRALDGSEVFREYSKILLAHDEAMGLERAAEAVRHETDLLDELAEFQQAVDSNPALKRKLMQAKAALEARPELIKQVDPNFIRGLELLDLE